MSLEASGRAVPGDVQEVRSRRPADAVTEHHLMNDLDAKISTIDEVLYSPSMFARTTMVARDWNRKDNYNEIWVYRN